MKMELKVVRYVVTCIDNGDSCDGRPRFLGAFETREKAKALVERDLDGYEKNGYTVDYDDMSAEGNGSCVWNIEEVEISVPFTFK